jgi:hypothetical protein
VGALFRRVWVAIHELILLLVDGEHLPAEIDDLSVDVQLLGFFGVSGDDRRASMSVARSRKSGATSAPWHARSSSHEQSRRRAERRLRSTMRPCPAERPTSAAVSVKVRASLWRLVVLERDLNEQTRG